MCQFKRHFISPLSPSRLDSLPGSNCCAVYNSSASRFIHPVSLRIPLYARAEKYQLRSYSQFHKRQLKLERRDSAFFSAALFFFPKIVVRRYVECCSSYFSNASMRVRACAIFTTNNFYDARTNISSFVTNGVTYRVRKIARIYIYIYKYGGATQKINSLSLRAILSHSRTPGYSI